MSFQLLPNSMYWTMCFSIGIENKIDIAAVVLAASSGLNVNFGSTNHITYA
jgi:hypothetical protein